MCAVQKFKLKCYSLCVRCRTGTKRAPPLPTNEQHGNSSCTPSGVSNKALDAQASDRLRIISKLGFDDLPVLAKQSPPFIEQLLAAAAEAPPPAHLPAHPSTRVLISEATCDTVASISVAEKCTPIALHSLCIRHLLVSQERCVEQTKHAFAMSGV